MPELWYQRWDDRMTCEAVGRMALAEWRNAGPNQESRLKAREQACLMELQNRPDARPLMNGLAHAMGGMAG